MGVAVSTALACVVVAACGGRSTPAPATPPKAAHPVKAEQPATASVPPAASAPTKPAKTAADHHREFLGGCAKRQGNVPEYCECAWGEFRKAFTDEEMSSGDMPAAKLDKLKGQVAGACSTKIPEDVVKEGFAHECMAKNPDMKSYCDCRWTEFRKRFSPAELVDEETVASERFLAARALGVKACGTKMPESVSKEAFMKGCAKDPNAASFCGCAWKELRKQASPGEIEAGTFDQKTIFASVEKTCGKMRPAKP